MRSMSAALEAHYQQQVTSLAMCLQVILTKRQPRVAGITNANPGVVSTLWPHGLADGATVRMLYVRGMTQVNEQFYQVTVIDPKTFSINADTSAFGVFANGLSYGVAQKVLGFTNHVEPLVFNGVIYSPRSGADGSAVQSTSDLNVTHLEMTGLVGNTADSFSRAEILRGVYDYAEFAFFEVNYADLSMGELKLPAGNFGEISLMENSFKVELLGLIDKLYQETGKLISIACPAELGERIPQGRDERFGCKVRLLAPVWQPETAYGVPETPHDAALGALVAPTTYNGRYFKCTTAGVSDVSEPTWDTAIGAATVDGTVTWTCVDAWTKYGEITAFGDRRTFADAARVEPNGWFDFGLVTFLSGNNPGFASEVKTYLRTQYSIVAVNTAAKQFQIANDQTAFFAVDEVFEVADSTGNNGSYTVVSASYSAGPPARTTITVAEAIPSATVDGHIEWRPGIFTLRDKAFADLQVGDEYEAQVGCAKFHDICISKFDNIYNFRGHPHVPGFHLAYVYPDAK